MDTRRTPTISSSPTARPQQSRWAFEHPALTRRDVLVGMQMVLTALIASRKDAILIPIPQYPIYSALISLLRGQQIGYQLDEEAQVAPVGRRESRG